MFHCSVTGKVSEPGEKLNKIVVATRDRVYYKRVRNEETLKWEDVECGRGWEIVKEINVSGEGLLFWNNLSEEEKSKFIKSYRK